MTLLGLCSDIQYLIGEWMKQNPRYRFKAVLEEIKNYEYKGGEAMTNLITSPPHLYAYYQDPDEGGWWFEDIKGDWNGENWVVKDYWDKVMELRLYQMEHEDEFYED